MVNDEREPLLQANGVESESDESIDEVEPKKNDALPENWSLAYRRGLVMLLAFMAFTVTFTCISVVPVASEMIADLNHGEGSRSASVLLVTIWELGEAAGPLLIAPLSEIYGRYPVLNAANVLFIIGIVVSALSQSVNVLVFSRFLTGCAVATNVLNPAIIGDMFPPEHRGTAMSATMLAPLLGGAVGPAIAGTLAQNVGWRWIMYMSLILAVIAEILIITLLRETYKVVILQKQSRQRKSDAEDLSLVRTLSRTEVAVWTSMTRPASVFWSSSILKALALYGSVAFTFFYIMSTTLPDILQRQYKFPPALIGTSFMSFSVGSASGLVVCNLLVDRIYVRLQKSEAYSSGPENRLPLTIVGAFCLPIAVATYGWVAALVLPAPLLLVAVAMMGFCLVLSVTGLMVFVVDAFGEYSASALTAMLITRCLMGTFLPLLTTPLTEAIGYGWGFMVLAAVCLLLAPIPLLVFWYGKGWRQSSDYTKDE
ncbi:hypothetical protein LTR95_002268 [Oleoguttula sp. CCFEE 5521]